MSRGGAWLRRAFLPTSIALLILAGTAVPLPAFIESPGSAAGIPGCVGIVERPDAAVNGDYLFTTVAQRNATVFGLLAALVRQDQQVVAPSDLLGDVRRDRYFERQRQIFIDSTDRAIGVALEAAGLPVELLGTGVDVVEVIDGAPADGVLQAGDIITAVDGMPVASDAELIAAIADERPLELRLRRDGAHVTEVVTPRVQRNDAEPRPMIGVRITTHAPEVRVPLAIDVSSGRVGGPSAGLMIGLAIFDLVDDEDLARGRRIAGTGTLALDGTVGPIDSIDLKVPAAAREGAEVFIAPRNQADAARAAVPRGSDLSVIGVGTFAEARRALARADATATATATSAEACRYRPDA